MVWKIIKKPVNGFTFHYASIKTKKKPEKKPEVKEYLHFTMLLLKHGLTSYVSKIYYVFTFHYASIKTALSSINMESLLRFTFHYASIKTRSFVLLLYQYLEIAFLSISFLFVFVVMLFTLNIFHISP